MTDNLAPEPYGAVPTRQQLAWQNMGMYAFIHFTVNTFTGKEWGDGTEPENVFNPTELDCEQWCKVISQAGFKGVVLTAKHHDGFCLWPSKYTTHSVKYSTWREGHGDVVGELAKAAKKYGLKLGLYLSPWDRHEPTYGTGEEYNTFYCNQLKELLTTYGGDGGRDIFMTWFDGACGEGPNGKVQVYDFERMAPIIRTYAPEAVIFGQMGDYRDIRWCGNERGYAGTPNWATVDTYGKEPQHGEVNGKHWWPAEVDVSIRPGWFYHPEQDTQVHSLKHLLDIWFNSVGRGACLNLNLPPDQTGQIHENDVKRVRELKIVLDKMMTTDFARGATVTEAQNRGPDFTGQNMTDGKTDTYWAPPDQVTECEAQIDLGKNCTFNVIALKEYTQLGQRVEEFSVEYQSQEGQWITLLEDTTISFRKILRTKTVSARKLRLKIKQALACPCIQEFSAFYLPPLLFAPTITRDLDGRITVTPPSEDVRICYTMDGSRPTPKADEYNKPFIQKRGGLIRAITVPKQGALNNYPELDTNPEANLRFGMAQEQWEVIEADSEYDCHHIKENVLTADRGSWLTAKNANYPHWITVDTGQIQTFQGVIITPPTMTECSAGQVAEYRIMVGNAPDKIDRQVATGTFDNILNNPIPQNILLKEPVKARYLRFEALRPASDTAFAAIKRLEAY